MNSSQLSRKLVRLWVVANLCSLVAVYGSLAPQIASLAETLGVTAMLVWDASLCSRWCGFSDLDSECAAESSAAINNPRFLRVVDRHGRHRDLSPAGFDGRPYFGVYAVVSVDGRAGGVSLAPDQVIGSVHFLTPGVRIPTKSRCYTQAARAECRAILSCCPFSLAQAFTPGDAGRYRHSIFREAPLGARIGQLAQIHPSSPLKGLKGKGNNSPDSLPQA